MTTTALPAPQVARSGLGLWGAFVFLDTATQLAFKWGADALTGMDFGLEMIAAALMTPGAWLAALGYFGTFLVWTRILEKTPLSRAFPMTGLAYVTVPFIAWAAIGEAIDLERALGIAAIVAGVVMLGRA